MNSLQAITDAWGNWFASQHGTSLTWTESTNYSNHSELDNYRQYQVTANMQNLVYNGNSLPTNGQGIVYQLWYNNNTKAQQQYTFAYTDTTTQTFTWTVTEALSVGLELNYSQGVPSIASSGQKITINFSFTSTQSQTKTNTQTWSVSHPVVVPPMSSVQASMAVNSQSYNMNFTASVLLNNNVNIWLNDPIYLFGEPAPHRCWFWPIEEVFQDCINNNIIDTSGYTVNGPAGSGVTVTTNGVFTGSQGISAGVNANQYPLNPPNVESNELREKRVGPAMSLLAIAGP